MVPSCAVTVTVIKLMPKVKGMLAEAAPDVTDTPFTFTVAWLSLVVGVIVMLLTLLASVTA